MLLRPACLLLLLAGLTTPAQSQPLPAPGDRGGALVAAAESLGVEMPRALWHAVSFHSSGRAVQQATAASGDMYEPYRVWSEVFSPYHCAVRAHWQPYLDGTTTMDAVALAPVRALTSE